MSSPEDFSQDRPERLSEVVAKNVDKLKNPEIAQLFFGGDEARTNVLVNRKSGEIVGMLESFSDLESKLGVAVCGLRYKLVNGALKKIAAENKELFDLVLSVRAGVDADADLSAEAIDVFSRSVQEVNELAIQNSIE